MKKFKLGLFIFLLGVGSCKKEASDLIKKQPNDFDPISTITDIGELKQAISTRDGSLSEDQQAELHRLRQAASILFELAKTSGIRSEIIAGVRSGFYEDESILFKDLFNSTQSPAFDFQSSQLTSNGFSSRLQNGNYLNSSEYGVTSLNPTGDNFNLKEYLECHKAQIYWPYSENWDGASDVVPTISYLPISVDEVNIGWKLVQNPGQTTYSYQEVVVNDEYAQNNPVFIVNYYEGNKIGGNCEYIPTVGGGVSAYDPPIVGEDCDDDFPQDRVQVDIGKVKFFKHYDGLFRGGPEFRFVRGQVSLNPNGNQITGVVPVFAPVNLKRKHIYEWRTPNELWDTNWELQNSAQSIVLYEDDDWSQTTLTLEGIVKVTIPTIGGIEESATWTKVVQSADAVIYSQEYDRCWYFVTSPGNTF
ncbi:MAG: hypothetical protein IPN76_23325 [Saprospiraceae bacterium]|nr:hypothetical protein [Saprospiraceae bacterium]